MAPIASRHLELMSWAAAPSDRSVLRWLTAASLAVLAYLALDQLVLSRPILHGPGVVAPDAPMQLALEESAPVFQKLGFRIAALASFSLRARVLSAESYCCWGENALVPVDVAFGWGRMSDERVLEHLEISQSRRFYFWRYENSPPIPRREIETSSANMHLIPANDAIEAQLRALRSGHIVTIEGYLVEARGDGGFAWRSSLGRGDTGNGACELVWVERLLVI